MKKNYWKFGDVSEKSTSEKKTIDNQKSKIFLTYFEILETKTLSENKGILLVVILNLQLIFMTASDMNTDLKNSFVESFLPISNYVLLYPVLLSQPTILFNLLFLIIVFILLAFLLIVIFYLASKQRFDNPIIKQLKSTWGFTSELVDKILLVPVFGLTVGNLACNYSDNQTECYGTVNIILIVISMLCSIMLLILEILFSYLFFNFTFKIKDSISRNPSGMPIFYFIYRFGITIFQSLFDLSVKSTYTILVLLHFIFGLIMMYDSLNNFPYHNKNVSKAQGIFSSAYLWINITFLVLQLTYIDMLHENVLVIVGLGMAFFLKLFLNIRNYFVKVLMNSELDEIQSAVLLDLKLRNYNTLAKTLDIKKSELLLASLLKIHSDKCLNLTCPCKKRNILIDPKKKINLTEIQQQRESRFRQMKQEQTAQLHKDQVFVKHFIARMVKDGLNKFKDSKLLYLDYMYYRFEALRLYSSIYFEVTKFEDKYHNDMSLSIEFCLYRLRARLRKYLQSRNQKSDISKRLMLENVKEFDEGIIQQKENIVNVNRNLNDLWESLTEEKPDLSKLLEIGNAAIKNMQITDQQYEKLLKLNNQSQDLKNLMTIYAFYLAYDDLLIKKIDKDIEQARDMENDNSFQQDFTQIIKKYQIFDKQSCVLSISPSTETLGQITWCSRNVFNVFGYDDSDLLTMNVNQLMPKPIELVHNKILKNFYDNGRELYTTKMTHIWCLDRDKICFSANIFIKILPSLTSYDIVGFVHKLNQDDYIVCDVDGMIYGVGKKVSEVLGISQDTLIDSQVNIQLLSPGINEVFKDYFMQFEGQQQQKGMESKFQYEDYNKIDITKDQKFFFLITKDLDKRIQSFIDARSTVFKKNNFDLQTKEQLQVEHSQQGGNQIKKHIKLNYDFKIEYASLFYKVNKKILIKSLEKMVKVKLQVKNFVFWNGSKMQKLKILKINSYEVKNKEYIKENTRKIKDLRKKVTELYSKVTEAVNEFKQKRQKLKQQEEQDQGDELEDKMKSGEQGEENPESAQLKGFANLFKKTAKGGGRQSIFAKMNRFGGGKGKQEQNENDVKQGILMTLFKPNLNKKGQKYKRLSKQQGSLAQTYGKDQQQDQDDEMQQKKKIELPPERLEEIKQCVAVPKILGALFKANKIGKDDKEWSIFFDKKKDYLPVDVDAIKFKKIRELVRSKKFQDYMETVLEQNNESHSSNTENQDVENDSASFKDSDEDSKNLLENFKMNQEQNQEEKIAQQSVSSNTSLQAYNAQRLLREQLKNMQAPTILIVAHFTMVILSLLLFSLIVAQHVLAKNDFNGIKQEVQMYQRLANYSDNLVELLDGYFTLEMVNEGPLANSSKYNSEWLTLYKTQLNSTQQSIVEFFLLDFSSAGQLSYSGKDLRSYLFEGLSVEMLVNGQPQSFDTNYENYVRLLLNAINSTLSQDLSNFSITSKQDYFYYIYHNLEPFTTLTLKNYQIVTSYLNDSEDQLSQKIYIFWICSFGILFTVYIYIYPIILKTKLKIQETLKIFTKIALADVEYYSTHYKMIFYLFKTIQDSPTLLKKIEEDVKKALDDKRNKDKENNNKIARSRNHKGIHINKVIFFITMTLWLLVFAGLLFLKDYFLIIFCQQLPTMFNSQEIQHKLTFLYQYEFIEFKNFYNELYMGNINYTQVDEMINLIMNQKISDVFTDTFKQLESYSPALANFSDFILTDNTCNIIPYDSLTYPGISKTNCESVIEGILKYGLLNYYQNLQIDILNGLNQIQTDITNEFPNEQLLNYIQQLKFQQHWNGLYYAKIINWEWSSYVRDSLFIAIDDEVTFNQTFVILLSIIITIFLVFVWGREYVILKRNSRWVNGFILLIPSQLRSENKHINSFLKNQLKIQGLMYL